jgi:hypothetical protein
LVSQDWKRWRDTKRRNPHASKSLVTNFQQAASQQSFQSPSKLP